MHTYNIYIYYILYIYTYIYIYIYNLLKVSIWKNTFFLNKMPPLLSRIPRIHFSCLLMVYTLPINKNIIQFLVIFTENSSFSF